MKQVVLIALLAGAVAGAGGAMITTVLTMPVAATSGSTALVDDGARGLSDEIAELRRENGVLLDRLRALEERPFGDASTRSPAGAEPVSYEELQREVASLKAAIEIAPGQVAPPAVRASVRAEIQSMEEEKARQEEIDREARRIERVDQRVTELSTTLALDSNQARQMRDVLLADSTRRDTIMNGMRDGGDFANGREAMQELRKELDASLTQILTPEQFQKYQESDSSGFGGRFGGDRGRAREFGDRGGRTRDGQGQD